MRASGLSRFDLVMVVSSLNRSMEID
jgi:hypothetical protein